MQLLNRFRNVILLAAVAMLLVAAPASSYAGGIVISVGFAPPILPVYAQPVCPGDGMIWTPGFWSYTPDGGYYWVPGVWVDAPTPGYLWTPAYWGYENNAYLFHAGYWGPTIGFYGGINYGFGYFGHGYDGGYWNGGHFFYNSSYNRIGGGFRNVYVRNVTIVHNDYARTSFNGGPHGVPYRASSEELRASRENHVGPTASQEQFRNQAQGNRAQFASSNGGRPGTFAAASTRDGFGHANEVNARQGNQQQRVNQGVRSGQMTPGETRNVENRDASINRQANADRAANGGRLSGQERQQINQRQNNVSQSINNDKHNANNDGSAAARQGRNPGGEQRQAQHTEKAAAPHPKEDHPKK